jgi:hypothetical protein
MLHILDHRTHGFVPSGVDVESIARQRPGFYSAAGWRDVDWIPPSYALVGFQQESERDLISIRSLLLAKRPRLHRLAQEISSVLSNRQLFFAAMFDYCSELYDLGIYSRNVRLFVAQMLERGLPAKGIGGLYDKAVLVLNLEEDRALAPRVADLSEIAWTWPSILERSVHLTQIRGEHA